MGNPTLQHRGRLPVVAGAALLVTLGCGGEHEPPGEDGAHAAPTSVVIQQSDAELRIRSAKPAGALESDGAERAHAAFWDAFQAERYEAIPGLIRRLTATVLENPRDPETVLLLAHTHLWKVAERARMDEQTPEIVDHVLLAEHYFEEAYRLRPEDHRILGWLGSVRRSLGDIRQDPVIAGEGTRLLQEGIEKYPEFNLFTAGYTQSGLPADEPGFRDALDLVWRNVDVCSGSGEHFATAETYEIARRADPSCANTATAPHSFEGLNLQLGDMLVKAGEPSEAISAYARARLAPTYADWPYRELLEERIRNVEAAAQGVRENTSPSMMFGSSYTCAACHARHPH